MNAMQLVGRLTRDPESRTSATAKNFTLFTVAVKKRLKPKSPEERDSDFFNVVCWGQNAEYAAKHLKKGRQVALTGRHESRQFTDQSGNKREYWEFTADSVHGLDRQKEDAASEAPVSTTAAAAQDSNGYDPFADE